MCLTYFVIDFFGEKIWPTSSILKIWVFYDSLLAQSEIFELTLEFRKSRKINILQSVVSNKPYINKFLNSTCKSLKLEDKQNNDLKD